MHTKFTVDYYISDTRVKLSNNDLRINMKKK